MAPAKHGNGFDPKTVQEIVEEIEEAFDRIESERGKYMAKCKSIREDIDLVKERAKALGIPKKELNAVLKTRAMQRKLEAIREALEEDNQELYDQLRHALGDLGAWAADDAAKQNGRAKRGEALDSLTH